LLRYFFDSKNLDIFRTETFGDAFYINYITYYKKTFITINSNNNVYIYYDVTPNILMETIGDAKNFGHFQKTLDPFKKIWTPLKNFGLF